MTHVVFVAPCFLENTLRYVDAFASLTEAELSVVSEDVEAKLPAHLRERIAGHYRVRSSLDARELSVAVRAIGKVIGRVDRLTGALEQLQLPMAAVREQLGIEGMWIETARRFRDKDRMKEVLRAAGVPVARSALARSHDDVRAFAREVGFPIVVKPRRGSARARRSACGTREISRRCPPSASHRRATRRCRSRSSCARGSTPARR
ncbi:MAG: hypothetical protein M5U28_04580 [Sandaracinaceae bacterium]|nr:hypothetical protein [Sandaracinaceae bacterium]